MEFLKPVILIKECSFCPKKKKKKKKTFFVFTFD